MKNLFIKLIILKLAFYSLFADSSRADNSPICVNFYRSSTAVSLQSPQLINLTTEKALWLKAVKSGKGLELDAMTKEILLMGKRRDNRRLTIEAIEMLTDYNYKFNFMYYLKNRIFNRIRNESSSHEWDKFLERKKIPETILRDEVLKMAIEFGFKTAIVDKILTPSEFYLHIRNGELMLDLKFIDENHGHLIHILQILQLAYHLEAKYKDKSIAVRFYKNLAKLENSKFWYLLLDSTNEPRSSPDYWNLIFKRYLNWSF